MKALDGREKGLLRKALEGVLPHDVLWRKKSPYPGGYMDEGVRSDIGVISLRLFYLR